MTMSMLPGIVVVCLHFLSLALTADLVTTEREGGLLQRDWTVGVAPILALAMQVGDVVQCSKLY